MPAILPEQPDYDITKCFRCTLPYKRNRAHPSEYCPACIYEIDRFKAEVEKERKERCKHCTKLADKTRDEVTEICGECDNVSFSSPQESDNLPQIPLGPSLLGRQNATEAPNEGKETSGLDKAIAKNAQDEVINEAVNPIYLRWLGKELTPDEALKEAVKKGAIIGMAQTLAKLKKAALASKESEAFVTLIARCKIWKDGIVSKNGYGDLAMDSQDLYNAIKAYLYRLN